MSFFDSAIEYLSQFSTANILAYLGQSNLGNLFYNPYFLGTMGILAVISLILKWNWMLMGVIVVTGCAGAMSFLAEKGTSLDGGLTDSGMLVFIGIGVVVIGALIYLLFIKSE